MDRGVREAFAAMRAGIVEGRGASSCELRRSAAALVRRLTGERAEESAEELVEKSSEMPAVIRALVEKVCGRAYRVTDEDVASAVAALGEEAVFELVVAASVEAGAMRADRGMAAVRASAEERGNAPDDSR
jgi:hypothetical protein